MSPGSFHEFSGFFAQHGITDERYLARHYRRFCSTKNRLESTRRKSGQRLLDIGAHWLHQSLLYARDGYAVMAADFPATFREPSVQSLARAYEIELIEYTALDNPAAFLHLPDNYFDVILFTEIIEHITFNPVGMWRELYRLLREGGTIVVTTPNYYHIHGRFWDWKRFIKGGGGGISVDDVICLCTSGHHWKEYSLRELREYFRILSPDFVIEKGLYVDDYFVREGRRDQSGRWGWLTDYIPLLRPNLHLEVGLPRKERGIIVSPGWG
jgi:2-polyprenyl-6-hydroxyphenyl methylase/3-demethylubiquinone-9 3-methyltransferase